MEKEEKVVEGRRHVLILFFGLPNNQNLFECFFLKEFVCFNITIESKVYSMESWTDQDNAQISHAGFLVL